MSVGRAGLLGGLVVLGSACSVVVESDGGASIPVAVSSTTDTVTSSSSSSTSPSTTRPSTTTLPSTTTTEPDAGVHDPDCVVVVERGDSLGGIAARFDDDTVVASTIRAENGIDGDVIHTGQLLDVCVDNGLDDITGEQRPERNAAVVEAETRANVELQQRKLNELFAGYGIAELLVDGVSGPVTRQRLCAARLSLGLPVSTADMVAGSEEEQALMAAAALQIPFTSAVLSDRWILVDQTCQIMFVGERGDRLVFVFPTSTGEPGHETRDQDRSAVYRYDPAADNGGWHDSTDFPVAVDNPLNGNMYRPLYFDGGQAIHGANNVPTSPQSKGCARLRVEHQDALVGWLGLSDVGGAVVGRDRIAATVNVQGAYAPV